MSNLDGLNTPSVPHRHAAVVSSTAPAALDGLSSAALLPRPRFESSPNLGSITQPASPSRKRTASRLDEEPGDAASNATGVAKPEPSGRHSRDFSVDSDICLCPPEPKIPRPPNCFMLFRKYHKDKIQAGAPEISSVLGEAWQSLSEEEQRPWKEAAEIEKKRHAQLYPNYRYQPNRRGRRNSLLVDSSASVSPLWCPKCGKPTMTSPAMPTLPPQAPPKPILPPPNSMGHMPNPRNLPPMSGLSLVSPQNRRHSTRPHPSAIQIPNNQPTHSHDEDIRSPDAKRRRTVYGPITSTTAAAPMPPTFPTASPYRQSFSHPDPRQYTPPGTAQPHQYPTSHAPPPPPSASAVRLPPLANANPPTPQSHTDTLLKSHPYLHPLRSLSRIAPPLPPATPPHRTRGALIALEGDDPAALATLSAHLATFLRTSHDAHVRLADGPAAPPATRPATTDDYWALVSEWRAHSRDIAAFLTTPLFKAHGVADEDVAPDETPAMLVPVVLVAGYMLHAADRWAAAVPREDGGCYSRGEHWSWMATLWRGVVGADVTVVVRDVDAAPGFAGGGRGVEVLEELRVVLVKKGRGEAIGEKRLRRVGFEIGEILRGVQAQGGAVAEGER